MRNSWASWQMFAALAALLLLTPLTIIAINRDCASSKGAAPDLHLHGRLAVYNGGYPNFRLWHIGTRHLYGIYGGASDRDCNQSETWENEAPSLPNNLNAMFEGNPSQYRIFGDFVIRLLDT